MPEFVIKRAGYSPIIRKCRHVSAGADPPTRQYTDTSLPASSFLAVYGSLRRRSLAKLGFFVLRNLRFHGHGMLRGLLFFQNGYPGVIEQSGLVRVEVYRVLSESVWEILDRYEGYRHSLGCRALFYRKEVALLRPEIRASVYFLGREVPRGKISIFRHGVDPDSH
jgi:gamma-glutamylcyclotransferase (GGCT)/AIG2-like uncharacterized protein YtfP